MASILAMLGSLGLTRRRRSRVCIGLVGGAHQLVVPGQAGKSFSVVGIGEKNLLPDLDGHVGPAAGFKGAGLLRQAGARGLSRAGDGAFLGVNCRERPAAGSPPRSNSLSKPPSPPSSALPFYFQFAPGTKPESGIEKSSSKQGKILIVIRYVLSIQSRSCIFLRVQANHLPGADPWRDRDRHANKATRPRKSLQVHLAPPECPGHSPFPGGHHDWQDSRSWRERH